MFMWNFRIIVNFSYIFIYIWLYICQFFNPTFPYINHTQSPNIKVINNMKKLLIAAALIFISTLLISQLKVTPIARSSLTYKQYLIQFAKPLQTDLEFLYRSKIFDHYISTMQQHNADPLQTWKMGINQFSDLTQQQFLETYLGEKSPSLIAQVKQQAINKGFVGEIDWRTSGIVTPIKNQGQCGSCWAFAATAAHQSFQIQFRSQPKEINLSQQQLVDCSDISPYYNEGCNGGYAVRALQFIKDFGQTTSQQYPYTAKTGSCQQQKGTYLIYGVTEVAGCDQIQQVIQRRPMAVRVDATNWSSYRSGIFDNCDYNINHAVFLVGSSDSAWTIKNSWGASWGEQGYIRLKKGNTCAVCQGPSFPI